VTLTVLPRFLYDLVLPTPIVPCLLLDDKPRSEEAVPYPAIAAAHAVRGHVSTGWGNRKAGAVAAMVTAKGGLSEFTSLLLHLLTPEPLALLSLSSSTSLSRRTQVSRFISSSTGTTTTARRWPPSSQRQVTLSALLISVTSGGFPRSLSFLESIQLEPSGGNALIIHSKASLSCARGREGHYSTPFFHGGSRDLNRWRAGYERIPPLSLATGECLRASATAPPIDALAGVAQSGTGAREDDDKREYEWNCYTSSRAALSTGGLEGKAKVDSHLITLRKKSPAASRE